ncbi:MAG: RluA family pseudouridine synthase [Lachnospiraceae bacterium]|nr:RluA family pseudouridine synthase [Lachnospiraceae bacterium]
MPGMDYSEYIAGEEDAGNRIDSFLADKLPLLSRSYIQKQIKEGNILVNGSRTKAGYKICASDTIKVYEAPAEELEIKPENIPLDIIYEDNDIIVINKPKRMVVHPAPGHYSGTVVNALLYHCRDSLSGINGIMRPGIVHRIDQDTTGAIVACKNDTAHRSLAGQLKEHSITRTYHAIVNNHTKEEEGTIKTTVGRHPVDRKKMAVNVKGGRDAVTHYKVLDYLDNRHTYIACNLETGRTHQIRVHMAYIGNPVLGDSLYGPAKCPFKLEGQALHAKTLGFIHPSTGKYMEFEAPLPDYFKKLLGILSHK